MNRQSDGPCALHRMFVCLRRCQLVEYHYSGLGPEMTGIGEDIAMADWGDPGPHTMMRRLLEHVQDEDVLPFGADLLQVVGGLELKGTIWCCISEGLAVGSRVFLKYDIVEPALWYERVILFSSACGHGWHLVHVGLPVPAEVAAPAAAASGGAAVTAVPAPDYKWCYDESVAVIAMVRQDHTWQGPSVKSRRKGDGDKEKDHGSFLRLEAFVFAGFREHFRDTNVAPDLMEYLSNAIERSESVMKQVRDARAEQGLASEEQ
jgi:hypothetical protein